MTSETQDWNELTNESDTNKVQQEEARDTFDTLELKMELLRGIYNYGFEIPSRIQRMAIPIMISRKDMIAQSQSGTGKTGSFVTGLLQVIDEKKHYPQGIIIAPTRELAQQIEYVVRQLGIYMKINTSLCIGGTRMNENISSIKKAHVIVGTPGRIRDMVEKMYFDPNKIEIIVMDEADKLLERDFVDVIKNIMLGINKNAQVCAFSATLTNEAMDITKKFMNNPVNMLIEKEKLTLDLIVQMYIDVQEEIYKLDTLKNIYEQFAIGQCIIYTNSKERATWLKAHLNSANTIHSGLSPEERTNVMKSFRQGEFRILISTDLLARGIDVQQVSYVINYDLPIDTESYLHRIGRSGRYGKKGVAINFATRKDYTMLENIVKHYDTQIIEMPEPEEVNKYLS